MILNWKLSLHLFCSSEFFILLAVSFDNILNSIECVINLEDIWRYLSKIFDIWVERYLTIFNDNLAIFNDRNVHTGAGKLLPKRYRQISSFIAWWKPSLNDEQIENVSLKGLEYVHVRWKMKSNWYETSNRRKNRFCSHDVSFRIYFKMTEYFDGNA